MTFTPGLVNRRDVLRAGALTVGATALPGELAAAVGSGKAKSVLYLWMAGGVTHIDSFDPKPDAPSEIRGVLGDIATSLPGVRFCETLPGLARIADRLAVVRSYSHESDDHLLSQAYTLSGRKVDMNGLFSEPNIGSLVAHLQGPRNGLPGYIAVPGVTRPGPPPHNLFVGGWLGSRHVPYALGGLPAQPDFAVGEKLFDPPARADEDLMPRSITLPPEVPLARLSRRVELRQSFDTALRGLERLDAVTAVEGQFGSALRLLSEPGIRRAFEIEKEPESVRDDYGRTKIGGRCLMARRLIESGARFVMVDYGYDPDYGNIWDNHNAPVQNHPPIQQMVKRGYHLAGMDRAFAALLRDMQERGLLDSTLVVFLTEFGRTPKINANGGRDHWGPVFSLAMAGGGVRAGVVHGASDRDGAYPREGTVLPQDITATIFHLLGIDPHTEVRDTLGRPIAVSRGEVIRQIV